MKKRSFKVHRKVGEDEPPWPLDRWLNDWAVRVEEKAATIRHVRAMRTADGSQPRTVVCWHGYGDVTVFDREKVRIAPLVVRSKKVVAMGRAFEGWNVTKHVTLKGLTIAVYECAKLEDVVACHEGATVVDARGMFCAHPGNYGVDPGQPEVVPRVQARAAVITEACKVRGKLEVAKAQGDAERVAELETCRSELDDCLFALGGNGKKHSSPTAKLHLLDLPDGPAGDTARRLMAKHNGKGAS